MDDTVLQRFVFRYSLRAVLSLCLSPCSTIEQWIKNSTKHHVDDILWLFKPSSTFHNSFDLLFELCSVCISVQNVDLGFDKTDSRESILLWGRWSINLTPVKLRQGIFRQRYPSTRFHYLNYGFSGQTFQMRRFCAQVSRSVQSDRIKVAG